MLKYTFSGFADEISKDLDTQIATLKEIGITHLELRSVDAVSIADFTMDFASEVKSKLDANGIKVSAIGSPIGKINIKDDFDEHFKKFEHIVKLAKFFETKYIRIFSFYIDKEEDPEIYFDSVTQRLKKFIEYAEKEDVILLHENEKGIYGDIDTRCKKLFDALYCDNFRCTYDPANFVQSGCDTLKAFELLKDYIEYMHIKDARFSDGLVVPPGRGDGNIVKLVENLNNMDYCGFISLEPHLKKFAGLEALENGENLSIDTTTEFDGPSAFKLAHTCMKNILSKY